VVIIIVGILATFSMTQYSRFTERARGTEARIILGQIRTTAIAYRAKNNNSCVGFDRTAADIGGVVIGFTNSVPPSPILSEGSIPGICKPTHYFYYTVTAADANGVTLTAIRCLGAAGKQPGGIATNPEFPPTLTLTIDFVAGTSEWGGTGGY